MRGLDETARHVENLPRLANICAAYATNLDYWGARLGVPRLVGGTRVPDADYRRMILGAFLAWHSTGTYSEIREIALNPVPRCHAHVRRAGQ